MTDLILTMKTITAASMAFGFILGTVTGIIFQRQLGIRSIMNMTGLSRVPALSPYQLSRIETLRNLPLSDGAVVFLGDSLIHAQEWHEVFGDTRVVSRAVPGATSRELAGVFDFSNAAGVFCLVGTNDAVYRVSPKQFIINYQKILDDIPDDTRVYLISIPPIRSQRGRTIDDHYLSLMNGEIRLLAESNNSDFLDLNTAFGAQSDEMFTADGLHLSSLGYRQLAELVKPAVSLMLLRPTK